MMQTRHWDRLGNGGLALTELGMGCAGLGNLFRAVPDGEARAILDHAWEAGLRYYDTAPLYGWGLSETRVNGFLRGKPRDDYVLSTKVGRLLEAVAPEDRSEPEKWLDVPSRRQVYDYSRDGILRSVEFSLERLGVDRVDMLFVHDIDVANHGSQEVLDTKLAELMESGYGALVELRDQGVIRAFGAGVNEWEPCQWLAERGDFDLFLLAGRYTLLEQEALETFLPLCQARGIGIVLGGPFNSGILATGARDGAHWNYAPAPQDVLDKVAAIERVCAAHGVALPAAALQFPLHHPSVLSVIPGAQSLGQVEANIAAARAPVPNALWSDLKSEGLMRHDAPIPDA